MMTIICFLSCSEKQTTQPIIQSGERKIIKLPQHWDSINRTNDWSLLSGRSLLYGASDKFQESVEVIMDKIPTGRSQDIHAGVVYSEYKRRHPSISPLSEFKLDTLEGHHAMFEQTFSINTADSNRENMVHPLHIRTDIFMICKDASYYEITFQTETKFYEKFQEDREYILNSFLFPDSTDLDLF